MEKNLYNEGADEIALYEEQTSTLQPVLWTGLDSWLDDWEGGAE